MIHETENGWVLVSGGAALGIGVDRNGVVVQTSLGAALPDLRDYPGPALPGHREWRLPAHFKNAVIETGEQGAGTEETLRARRETGTRGLVLRYAGAQADEAALSIRLQDAALGVDVELDLRVAPIPGLFTIGLSLRNSGAARVVVERLLSLTLHLPQSHQRYAMTHFDGAWGDELRLNRDVIGPGSHVRESRRLVTSHEGTPFFAVDHAEAARAASEDRGVVWFGALAWSGNWKLIGEGTRDGRARLHLGMNDHDFALPLDPGEEARSPEAVFGYVADGFGAMSRALHDWQRDHVAPRRSHTPPVVYNSWYATEFGVNADQQIALARKAAAMGVEMFVLDDGWFSGRVNDRAGLGDWWVDASKFPGGLTGLCDAVHGLGMGFGLWIEPEMVNPDSDLYRAHPDWVVHFADRPRTTIRHQLMLNLARTEVQDYLIGILDRLLCENPIDFIKWDMNRSVTEPGWPDCAEEPRRIWVDHTRGVYRVWDTLRTRHPDVIWENCAGGGGRLDLGLASRSEQAWASDNVSAPARLHIQHSYSMIFPAGTMASWVCDDPTGRQSLAFRFHRAMAGALGIGGDLSVWDDAALAEAAAHVATYKSIRDLVTFGDLYRLSDITRTGLSAPFFVGKDGKEAALILARLGEGRPHHPVTIHPRGLHPDARYGASGRDEVLTGVAWRQRGLITSIGPYQSEVIRFRRIDA